MAIAARQFDGGHGGQDHRRRWLKLTNCFSAKIGSGVEGAAPKNYAIIYRPSAGRLGKPVSGFPGMKSWIY